MKKRLLSFVLAALMIASLLPATALAADIVDSGTCGAEGDGSNLTWTLDSEGVLTISGSGDMHGYDHLGAPWYGIRSPVKSAVIADGVTSIGDSAFFDCTSLTSVTIPDSVTSIGEYAFYGCTSLTGIWVAEGNSHYASDASGVLFNKDKTTLVQCPGAFAAYTIPNSVTSIGADAFSYCRSLTSVTIPDSVTSIGESSFYKCTSLTSVTIPDSVTSIGYKAFGSCESLTSVTIPDSVTSIGDGAFSCCTSLTSVTIPNSVTSIGDSAFYDCTSLTSVTIPNSVTIIGVAAFSCCTSLTSVTIPDSVTIIGGSAFFDCDNLTDVYYTGTEIAWNKIKISDYSDVLKNATIHYFSEWTREKEPTCTEPGSETSVCPEAGCGKTFTREIPALGHSWDEGKVTKPATEAEDGVKTFTCTRCGETKTETIPATGSDVDVTEMFSDVTKNWAYPGIQYCVTHKLMGSTGGDKFAPTMTTTRAQIVQILYNLEGEPKVSGTTPFTDLTQDWYQDAVLWAYQTGVVAGTGDGTTFDPDLPVTREQIAVILMEYTDRILNIKRTWTPADLSTFPDADSVSDWAKDAMADAVALGLISGASNGGQTLLEPQGSATREQVATILMEFCKNVKK